MTDVLTERARVERILGGHTLVDHLASTASQFPDEPAYSDRHEVSEGWRTLSWTQTREAALDVAAGLIALGVEPGQPVAIMATNRIEHVLADMGAVHAAAIPMSIYNTLSPDQVAYIADHSGTRHVIVESADHLARWSGALVDAPDTTVVVIDEAAMPEGDHFLSWSQLVAAGAALRRDRAGALEARAEAVTPSTPATILYTSGTTGNPKGVVLTHHNVLCEAQTTIEAAGLMGQRQVQISYLPLAHIAERVLGVYGPTLQGSHQYCIGDPAQLVATLGEVHPTAFFGVPRVWEKIQTGISAKLAADPNPDNVTLVQESMAAGLAWVQAQETGGTMTPEIEENYRKADEAILGFLKLLLGLDQARWCASASAPMPVETTKFMAGLGLRVYDVYGMTETCGAVTVNGPDHFRIGSVGVPTPGMEVMLADDGEILVRGPVNTPGYYRQDEATRQLIDSQGWLHTGDIGTQDEDGFFYVVDRKKELIITSAGKNIAPSNIENHLKESPLIGHAMAIGDNRPYVVAVLTLDGEVAPVVAERMGLEFTSLADLSAKAEIRALVQAAVDKANERLSRPEQVKAFALLAHEWTAESEELTPSLKLKRRVVHRKYADVVDELYAEGDRGGTGKESVPDAAVESSISE
ncbi:AMP-dependent synthetase/ligase [Nocardioides jishulii]|uniref:Acyl-CoA synthetase n=1 Tax=Nocardioides jishulii TaxID=2575440 RepID=A0A4U2YTF4_9ACTN|nr:long-chain fatty acid--CoA ligase [Nocardioides jishulii]QCX28340.1 AMP-binding protein [Nocardioides jishulii]TKI64767.1 long-chain fatty acid--CoA ligase [Nocardioides jishulii]